MACLSNSRRRLDRSNGMPSDVRSGGDSHKPMEAIHGTPLLEPAPTRHNEAKDPRIVVVMRTNAKSVWQQDVRHHGETRERDEDTSRFQVPSAPN
ncbi:hypothetical protein TgHK011_002229 [Trichoderma gracile]|nr:hypothetical protein TgHK011_002229 [Trichoderma gracile]